MKKIVSLKLSLAIIFNILFTPALYCAKQRGYRGNNFNQYVTRKNYNNKRTQSGQKFTYNPKTQKVWAPKPMTKSNFVQLKEYMDAVIGNLTSNPYDPNRLEYIKYMGLWTLWKSQKIPFTTKILITSFVLSPVIIGAKNAYDIVVSRKEAIAKSLKKTKDFDAQSLYENMKKDEQSEELQKLLTFSNRYSKNITNNLQQLNHESANDIPGNSNLPLISNATSSLDRARSFSSTNIRYKNNPQLIGLAQITKGKNKEIDNEPELEKVFNNIKPLPPIKMKTSQNNNMILIIENNQRIIFTITAPNGTILDEGIISPESLNTEFICNQDGSQCSLKPQENQWFNAIGNKIKEGYIKELENSIEKDQKIMKDAKYNDWKTLFYETIPRKKEILEKLKKSQGIKIPNCKRDTTNNKFLCNTDHKPEKTLADFEEILKSFQDVEDNKRNEQKRLNQVFVENFKNYVSPEYLKKLEKWYSNHLEGYQRNLEEKIIKEIGRGEHPLSKEKADTMIPTHRKLCTNSGLKEEECPTHSFYVQKDVLRSQSYNTETNNIRLYHENQYSLSNRATANDMTSVNAHEFSHTRQNKERGEEFFEKMNTDFPCTKENIEKYKKLAIQYNFEIEGDIDGMLNIIATENNFEAPYRYILMWRDWNSLTKKEGAYFNEEKEESNICMNPSWHPNNEVRQALATELTAKVKALWKKY